MVDYFWYTDDILIVPDSTTTNIIELRKEFNNLDRNLNFNLERQGKGENKFHPHHHHYPDRRSSGSYCHRHSNIQLMPPSKT